MKNFADIQRFMLPPVKMAIRFPKVVRQFKGDTEKIAVYLQNKQLMMKDRVASRCFYGPITDKEKRVLAAERRNPARKALLGKHHVHYTLHWQFTK